MDTIKCGRKVFELEDGDTIMDNGACLQLISRKSFEGWYACSPSVSKAAFKAFKNNPKVKIDENHTYGSTVILYRYIDR